jgi:hypothetical protein
MCAEIDFKTLWNKEGSGDIPDTKQLFKKAHSLRRAARIRLIFQTLTLLASAAIIMSVGFNIDNRKLTTTVGCVLIVAGIASYLIVVNQLLPMLFKSNIENTTQEYLNQLIRIKRKLEFLDRVMINIYFSLLCSGLFLYMLQFAARMSMVKGVLVYVITFTFMGIAWFYAKTWENKKRIKPLNDMIKRLEAVNEQLRDGEAGGAD